jgi:hypothetical protein
MSHRNRNERIPAHRTSGIGVRRPAGSTKPQDSSRIRRISHLLQQPLLIISSFNSSTGGKRCFCVEAEWLGEEGAESMEGRLVGMSRRTRAGNLVLRRHGL